MRNDIATADLKPKIHAITGCLQRQACYRGPHYFGKTSTLMAALCAALTACAPLPQVNAGAFPASVSVIGTTISPGGTTNAYAIEGDGYRRAIGVIKLGNRSVAVDSVETTLLVNGEPVVILNASSQACAKFYVVARIKFNPPAGQPVRTCSGVYSVSQPGPTEIRFSEQGAANPRIFTYNLPAYRAAIVLNADESGLTSEIEARRAARAAEQRRIAQMQEQAELERQRAQEERERSLQRQRDQAIAEQKREADEAVARKARVAQDHEDTLKLLEQKP